MKKIYLLIITAFLNISSYGQKLESPIVKEEGETTELMHVNVEKFSVTPNPANGIFTVHYEGLHDPGLLKVFNLLGEQVYKGELHNNEEKIDLSKHEKGVYFVELSAAGKKMFKRVLKL